MITPEQEAWLDTLSDRLISILPYDPRSEELFDIVKKKIIELLGEKVMIEHGGSTVFRISGQDEIDVAIVVSKEEFAEYVPKLEAVFGPARSNYEDRIRFEAKEGGKKIDLKIVDRNHPNYSNGKIFEKYLSSHPEELNRYRVLKEECDGLTVKEYYRRKTEFSNEILAKASKE